MMNRKIDEEHPGNKDVQGGPEFGPRGLRDHPCDFRCRERANRVMKVIHKRLRATNLPVEEEVGEPRKDKIQDQRKGQETEERPHTLVSRKNNALH